MKKYYHVVLSLILILVPALTGCGGGNGGNGGNGNPGGSGGNSGGPITYTPGQLVTYTVGGVPFNMHYVPGGLTFPTNSYIGSVIIDDTIATVANAYWIAETEVTYELWSVIYKWATGDINMNGSIDGDETAGTYTLSHTGAKGNDNAKEKSIQHPVTTINWREAMVWCNALTEYYNATNTEGISLVCVYTLPGGDIAHNATDLACDSVTASSTAKGFRLPTSNEWELAARYRGSDPTNTVSGYSNPYFTKGNSASGATGAYNTTATDDVAVYNQSSVGTAVVKSKGINGANTLGLYDMNGNVTEYCFDIYHGSARLTRSGSWGDAAINMQLGSVHFVNPGEYFEFWGFRLVRTQ